MHPLFPKRRERSHDALELDVPSSRYRVSPREYPEQLPPVEYGSDVEVRKANRVGQISFRGQIFKVSEAFAGNRSVYGGHLRRVCGKSTTVRIRSAK